MNNVSFVFGQHFEGHNDSLAMLNKFVYIDQHPESIPIMPKNPVIHILSQDRPFLKNFTKVIHSFLSNPYI